MDENELTFDFCENPGTINSSCTHTPIVCEQDSNCGTNGFIGNTFCKNGSTDVFQDYISYTCNNPGTLLSYCSNSTEDSLKQDCCTSGSGESNSVSKRVVFTARDAPLGSTGYCKTSPTLIYSDLTGVEKIKISDISGSICSRSANGACSDGGNCMAGFKHNCADGTQGTIGVYNANNKLIKEYSIAQVKNGVVVPAGAKKVYVYFKDSFYNDNNAAFKCSFNFTKTITAPKCLLKCADGACVNVICSSDADCNDNNRNTEDKCINPGTANSRCTHTPIACFVDSDCGPINEDITLGRNDFANGGKFAIIARNEGLKIDIYSHFGNTQATAEKVCALTEKYQTQLGLDHPYTTLASKQPYRYVSCWNDYNYIWKDNKWVRQGACTLGYSLNTIVCRSVTNKKCINPGTGDSRCVAV